ncbi:MAG: CRISPR-associated endonuclease Cas2 [Mariniphaga sp.]
MKQFIIVAYDIGDNKRRLKIAKTLETYGVRSNFSVFECVLTESQMKTMQKRLNKIADPSTDCILYYYLCKSCVGKREVFGRQLGFRSEIVWV